MSPLPCPISFCISFILVYYIVISLQGWSSLWGGLRSELRLCYLLKQQADAAVAGSFLPALLLLGNCPNQAGLLTHLQQSSSLVPKPRLYTLCSWIPDWSIQCLRRADIFKWAGLVLVSVLPSPGFSGFFSWDIMLFWIETNSQAGWLPVDVCARTALKFPSLKSSLWGLQGAAAFFQSALRNAGHWLLINNLSDTSALCSDPGCLLGQRCSPQEFSAVLGWSRMKAKHQPHSLHSLKG